MLHALLMSAVPGMQFLAVIVMGQVTPAVPGDELAPTALLGTITIGACALIFRVVRQQQEDIRQLLQALNRMVDALNVDSTELINLSASLKLHQQKDEEALKLIQAQIASLRRSPNDQSDA